MLTGITLTKFIKNSDSIFSPGFYFFFSHYAFLRSASCSVSGWSTEGLLKTALRTPIYSSHQEKKEVLSNIHALQELLLTTLKLCFWCLITCASWWNNVKFFWVAPTYTLVPHMKQKYSNVTRAAGFLLCGWHLNGFRCRRYFFIFIFIVAAGGKTLLSPWCEVREVGCFHRPRRAKKEGTRGRHDEEASA